MIRKINTSLAAKRALAHCLQRLQNPKWPPAGPKMANGVWKGVYPWVFGHSKQLSQNKFFDPSTPSVRKGHNGEKKKIASRTTVAKGNKFLASYCKFYLADFRASKFDKSKLLSFI